MVSQLKHLIADLFRLDILDPEKISDDEPLQGGSLDLDSLDALELALCIEEIFGLTILRRDSSPRPFSSIANLASYICENANSKPISTRESQSYQNSRPVLASAARA